MPIKINVDFQDAQSLKGWLISENPFKFLYLKTNREVLSLECTNFYPRPDVNRFYNIDENSLVGFTFNIPNYLNGEVAEWWMDDTYIGSITLALQSQINNTSPSLMVVDNFYNAPDTIRNYALSQWYFPDIRYYKGSRTKERLLLDGVKERFETLIGKKIINWDYYHFNGVFQSCTSKDLLVYHADSQAYAAIIYLTPDAPYESGTNFYASRINGLEKYPTEHDVITYNKTEKQLFTEMFNNDFYDKTRFELIDSVGNKYNRLIIFDAKRIHSASCYFGNEIVNSRLFQIFFFDVEDHSNKG